MKLIKYLLLTIILTLMFSCETLYLIYKSTEKCIFSYDMYYNTLNKMIEGSYKMVITDQIKNEILNIEYVKFFVIKNNNEFSIILTKEFSNYENIKKIGEKCVEILNQGLKNQCIMP